MSTVPNAVAADEERLIEFRPAFLRRVRIRNYKSIAFCDVTLEPLTILVGRNGAGKSNFLDSLAFVGELASRDIRDVIDDHGGPDALMCRARGPVDSFSITIDSRVTDPDSPDAVEVRYRFAYFPRRRSWADRVEETLSFPDRGNCFTYRSGRIEPVSAMPNPGYSLLTVLADPISVALRRGLRGLRQYILHSPRNESFR